MELLQKLVESLDYVSLINTSFRITFILFIAWLLTFFHIAQFILVKISKPFDVAMMQSKSDINLDTQVKS